MIIIIIYFIFSMLLLSKCKPKDLKKIILMLSIVIGVLAFFKVVYVESDLYTAFQHLNNIRKVGWIYFSSISNTTNYFTGKISLQLYFYFLSYLRFNNFYSGISMFIVYYLSLTSIHKVSSYYHILPRYEKILLLSELLLLDFYDNSDGVRNILAFSIFTYYLIDDILLSKNKIKCVFMYLIAITIHPATIPLILLRFIISIKNKYLKVFLAFFTIFWSNGLENLRLILYPFENIGFVKSIILKIDAYTTLQAIENYNFASTSFNNSPSYIMMRHFRFFMVVVAIMLIIYLCKKNRKIPKFVDYTIYLSLFMIGSMASTLATNVFTRYSFELIMVFPLVYVFYYSNDKNRLKVKFGKKKIDCFEILLLICIVLFNYYMFKYHYSRTDFAFNFYN